jgi:hypothetical protein
MLNLPASIQTILGGVTGLLATVGFATGAVVGAATIRNG